MFKDVSTEGGGSSGGLDENGTTRRMKNEYVSQVVVGGEKGKHRSQKDVPIPSARPSSGCAPWVNEKVAVMFYCLESAECDVSIRPSGWK